MSIAGSVRTRAGGRQFCALAIAALGWLGCLDEEGGAVSVRWRIVDLKSGGLYDPREQTGTDGSCRCLPRRLEDTSGPCAEEYGWTVHRVRLRVIDPESAQEVLPDDPRLVFRCSQREATTPFILPSGRFGLGLEAFNPSNPTASTRVLSPPPTLRDIFPASKTNLDVIEIGVNGPPAP